MVSKEFFEALNDLEKERRIDKAVFVDALEQALTSAYKKNYGEAKSAIVKLNEEKHTIKIYSYKTVVETVEDPDKEISLADAQLLKKSYKIGDLIEQEETPKDFGRIAAQIAKQVVLQKLREAEKELTMSEISEKEDELLTTIVNRIDGKNIFVEIGTNSIEAVMDERDQIPGEHYAVGQRLKVYVKKIKDNLRGTMVQVSRANVGFVKKLFELEIPEIQSGEVVINAISREAGYRTKIAVSSTNSNLDPVGACVGNKGMRINSLVDELNGEKIDVIEYSDKPEVFVERALSPATVVKVEMLTENSCRAIVPDDKLSLAIGKAGQNVRLAARLTKMKIDVKPESIMEGVVVQKESEKPSIIHLDDFNGEDLNLDEMFKDDDNNA